MKKVILALAIASVSFVACNNSAETKEAPKTDSTAPKMDTAKAVVADTTSKMAVDTTKKVVADTAKKVAAPAKKK